MPWRFALVLVRKNREEIGMFLFEEGEKIGTSGQNIYPWGVGQKISTDAPELCEQFLDDMQQLSNRYDIILNADETPMYFDLPASKTIDLAGVQSVIVKTTGHEMLDILSFLHQASK